jgi:hypothetical protein
MTIENTRSNESKHRAAARGGEECVQPPALCGWLVAIEPLNDTVGSAYEVPAWVIVGLSQGTLFAVSDNNGVVLLGMLGFSAGIGSSGSNS